MKFCFEKNILNNYEKSIEYEWLEYNRLGSYSSSTIIGLNTRREHGLLNIPYEDGEKTAVLLSKLEESVFIGNRLYEISTNKYVDSTFPEGYHFIEKFALEPFPTTYFRIEDRLLKKTVFLLQDKNILVVRYELKNQGKPIKLVVKPFLAVRDTHELTEEIQGLNTDSYLGQNFVRWAPKPDMPELNVIFNRGEFIPATLWYHNFSYLKDQKIYSKSIEDLFNPGFFQLDMKPYQTFDMFISPDSIDELDLDFEYFYRELAAIKTVDHSSGKLSAMRIQFQQIANKDKKIAPLSFLKSKKSLRDILFVMPALISVNKNPKQFLSLFNNILKELERGLLPNEFPCKETKSTYEQADTSLWMINFAYYYYQQTGDKSIFSDAVIEHFKNIISAFTKGTTANIYVDNNVLVFSGDKATNTGWLPLKDKQGSFLRYGYLLEVNALWYNALKILESIFKILGKNRQANKYAKIAAKVQTSFKEKFFNEKTSLFYDFVSHQFLSEDFRINQIIPLALPFSVIEPTLAKRVLLKIDEELVTPYGLRVLSEKQNKHSIPDKKQLFKSNAIYLNEAILPWTIFLYVQASQNYKKENPNLNSDLMKYFQPVFDLLEENILGFFPEAIYLDEHLQQFGIEDSTLSLANIALAFSLLEQP